MNREQIINKAFEVNQDKRMLKVELELLYDYVDKVYKGGHSLEIGAYKGMTSYVLASFVAARGKENSKHFIVDAFSQVEKSDNNWLYEEHPMELLLNNTADFQNSIIATEGYSTDNDIADEIISREYDYIWIDGDHRAGTLYLELLMADTLTDNIVMHDYGHPGVLVAVDKFCEKKGYKLNLWRPGELGLAHIEK